jgi:dephospho-CoA kinase
MGARRRGVMGDRLLTMLSVGLTGGIGSGKSTVAQRFRQLGAEVIDADQLAREVVAVGSSGLAAIRERFGDAVVAADGSLDRAELGEIVFADAQARKDLEAITHPLIGARTRLLVRAAAPERVLVHDVPLLVELDLAASYHLTVVVGADQDIRIARLTGERALSAADARARIAAQAGDRARRAAADAWLDNSGTVAGLLAQVDALWRERIVGFNDNLMSGSHSHPPNTPTLVSYDDSWPLAAARLIARTTQALGERAVAVEHIGSTAVPGLSSREVIDLQVGVRTLADADIAAFVRALSEKGFPRSAGEVELFDDALPWIADPGLWAKRCHANADPARVVHMHVREIDGPGWRYALLLRDWLRAQDDERDAYGALKVSLAQSAPTTSQYTQAKGPWIVAALVRADTWARGTRWSGRE